MDVAVAAAALVVCSPVLAVAALAIRLTSRGPVVFRQDRVGAGGQRFVCLKLRTMRTGTSDATHRAYVREMLSGAPGAATEGVFKLVDDPRVTPVGRWLRRTSLDELPQLVNVLRGEMALVGPRPMLEFEVELLAPWQMERFAVRPGLTGLWQVSGRSTIRVDDAIALDVEYARTRSPLLDAKILVRTPATLLRLDRAA